MPPLRAGEHQVPPNLEDLGLENQNGRGTVNLAWSFRDDALLVNETTGSFVDQGQNAAGESEAEKQSRP